MAKHRKVFRFRMEPKPDQGQALARMAGARRFIWNWGLARWKAHYQATGKSISLKQLSAELTALKQQPDFRAALLKAISGRFLPTPPVMRSINSRYR